MKEEPKPPADVALALDCRAAWLTRRYRAVSSFSNFEFSPIFSQSYCILRFERYFRLLPSKMQFFPMHFSAFFELLYELHVFYASAHYLEQFFFNETPHVKSHFGGH